MTCDEQAAMLVSTIDFEVDMNGSMYPNADYGHVVLNGDWPGAGPWNGWGLELFDEDGDGVYTGSLTLDVGTSFEYVVAVTGAADGWSGWGQQFGQPDCNGANFTATAPADGNTSATVSISVDDLSADVFGICGGGNSLQNAIDLAAEGSTLDIPAGTYVGPFSIDKILTLNLSLIHI